MTKISTSLHNETVKQSYSSDCKSLSHHNKSLDHLGMPYSELFRCFVTTDKHDRDEYFLGNADICFKLKNDFLEEL